MTAYYTAAFTMGTEGLPELADLLSDEPRKEASPEAFHERMRELGWEK